MAEVSFTGRHNMDSTFYRFISLYQDYLNQSRNYGDGRLYTMTEMHILTIVCSQPGITVGQVASQWGRTKGAASQNITKLEKRGLLVRTKLLNNAKQVHLYPTKEGQALASLHEQYDSEKEREFYLKLIKRCSMEELEEFDRIMSIYCDLLEEDMNC